jgi:putative (di)nucleoside polyphosphate hydrolase
MTSDALEELPYRPCVGAMVLNGDGFVFLGHRADGPEEPEGPGTWWQMPQGGIDEGEDPREAVLRENSTRRRASGPLQIIAESPAGCSTTCRPNFRARRGADAIAGRSRNGSRCASSGDETEIDVCHPPGGHTSEFNEWKWVPVGDVPRLVVPFKRYVYEQHRRRVRRPPRLAAFTHAGHSASR